MDRTPPYRVAARSRPKRGRRPRREEGVRTVDIVYEITRRQFRRRPSPKRTMCARRLRGDNPGAHRRESSRRAAKRRRAVTFRRASPEIVHTRAVAAARGHFPARLAGNRPDARRRVRAWSVPGAPRRESSKRARRGGIDARPPPGVRLLLAHRKPRGMARKLARERSSHTLSNPAASPGRLARRPAAGQFIARFEAMTLKGGRA